MTVDTETILSEKDRAILLTRFMGRERGEIYDRLLAEAATSPITADRIITELSDLYGIIKSNGDYDHMVSNVPNRAEQLAHALVNIAPLSSNPERVADLLLADTYAGPDTDWVKHFISIAALRRLAETVPALRQKIGKTLLTSNSHTNNPNIDDGITCLYMFLQSKPECFQKSPETLKQCAALATLICYQRQKKAELAGARENAGMGRGHWQELTDLIVAERDGVPILCAEERNEAHIAARIDELNGAISIVSAEFGCKAELQVTTRAVAGSPESTATYVKVVFLPRPR